MASDNLQSQADDLTLENNFVPGDAPEPGTPSPSQAKGDAHSNIFGKNEHDKVSLNSARRRIILKYALAEFLKVLLEFKSQACDLGTEFMSFEKLKFLRRLCTRYYEDALALCDKNFNVLSPQRIKLRLSYNIFVYEILGEQDKARRDLKRLFMDSLKDLNRFA